jgi:hypothetical protein
MVLGPGGSQDADALLRNFLGRDPTQDAFLKSIGLGGAAGSAGGGSAAALANRRAGPADPAAKSGGVLSLGAAAAKAIKTGEAQTASFWGQFPNLIALRSPGLAGDGAKGGQVTAAAVVKKPAAAVVQKPPAAAAKPAAKRQRL